MRLKEESCRRLVYVGDDGDVYSADGDRRPHRLTWGWADALTQDRLYYIWPAYSPDGSHVACFGVRTGASPEAGLYAIEDDGVQMHEIWKMREAAPICESWSPDSRHIAILLQSEKNLRLEVADIRRPGATMVLDEGAPVFWAWSPSDDHIAVHTGGSRTLYQDARLVVFRIDGVCERVATLPPGEFRTPAWSPDGRRLAYVDASDGKREHLAFYRVGDGVGEIICPVDGHTVMLWAPDGCTVAIAQAMGDSPHLYRGLTLVDAETGRTKVLDDSELASFFWSPCSRRLIVMAFEERSGMHWSVLELDGSKRSLGSPFFPSRELVYFCWFFDQFAVSHPLVSADGSHLAFAGHIAGAGVGADGSQSHIYVTSIDGEGPPERVAAGHFACWDARLRQAGA